MNLRVPVRTFEVVNFFNLAVRTHKPKTFEMLNHHEPNVALDVAQAYAQANAGRRFFDQEVENEIRVLVMRSTQQRLAAIAAQRYHANQSYSG